MCTVMNVHTLKPLSQVPRIQIKDQSITAAPEALLTPPLHHRIHQTNLNLTSPFSLISWVAFEMFSSLQNEANTANGTGVLC